MKKYLTVVIPVFLILLVIIIKKPKKHDLVYTVDNIKIKESYIEKSYPKYEITLTDNTKVTTLTSNISLNKSKQIINKIETIRHEGYTCYIINFKESSNENYICNYKQNSLALNSLSKTILEKIQQEAIDKHQKIINIETQSDVVHSKDYQVYETALKETIIFESYKGYINTKNEVREIELSDKEIYSKDFFIKSNNKLIVADPSDKYRIKTLLVIDPQTDKIKEIKLKKELTYDNIFQGTIGSETYLINKDTNTQYKLDSSNNIITEIGNKSKGIKLYKDNEFSIVTIKEALKEPMFENPREFYKINIKKNITSVEFVKNQHKITLLRESNIEIIEIKNDSIYYLKDDTLYKQNFYGSKEKLIKNNNFIYNEDMKIYIYERN